MVRPSIILFVAAVSMGAAQTQVKPKIYGVVGVQACNEFVSPPGSEGSGVGQMRSPAMRAAVVSWAMGYVTGAAAILAERGIVLRDTTENDLVARMTTYCLDNPKATIEAASAALVRELSPKR